MRKAIVVLALILSACNSRRDFERPTPKEDKDFAIHTFEQLQQRRFSEVEPLLDRGRDETLAEIADSFDNEKPLDMRVIGEKTFLTDGIRRTFLTVEYQMPSHWVFAGMTLRTQNGKTVIETMHAGRTLESAEQRARFTFHDKSATQYIYLALAFLVPLFILVTLYVLWQTPVARFKWLWFIFVAFGICTMSVNWMNGLTGVHLLWPQILGSGIDEGSRYSPVIVSWAIPVGAIVFLLRRRSLMPPG